MYRRSFAWVLDMLFFMGGVLLVEAAVVAFIAVVAGRGSEDVARALAIAASLVFLIGYLTKDSWFCGRSIGKIMCGIRVVDKSTQRPASALQSFKRNLPLLVPYHPLIAGIQIHHGDLHRLGDDWANTKVVPVTPEVVPDWLKGLPERPAHREVIEVRGVRLHEDEIWGFLSHLSAIWKWSVASLAYFVVALLLYAFFARVYRHVPDSIELLIPILLLALLAFTCSLVYIHESRLANDLLSLGVLRGAERARFRIGRILFLVSIICVLPGFAWALVTPVKWSWRFWRWGIHRELVNSRVAYY